MSWAGATTMDAEASELLSRVQSGEREVNRAWARRLDDGLEYYRYVSSNDDENGTRAAACEIAVAWRCSTGQADHLLRCRRLLDHLPALAEAFDTGEVSVGKLKALYHRASRGYRDALIDLDGVLAEDAMLLSDNVFAEELDRHLLLFEPDVADDDDVVDPARRVVVRRRAGGMASLITACTAEEAVRAKAQLDDMAPDDRAGQVDAVLDAIATGHEQIESAPDLSDGTDSEQKPARLAPRAWTELVVDLPTVLGLSANPGYLLGYGPLDGVQSRMLADKSRWRGLVTIGEQAVSGLLDLFATADGSAIAREDIAAVLMNSLDGRSRIVLGEKALGVPPPVKAPPDQDGHGGWSVPPPGALRYRPGAKLARMVRALDGHCRYPGCLVPADRCELDHIVPFNYADPLAGGWTIEANLECLCKEHHDLKTLGIITATLIGDREIWINTRAGQEAITRPAVRQAGT
ncbi:HNH endonuclease signature motif containing protein [Williamsia sp. D3]|uniref:HNH endonuclease signature motif containing protein n=1 Tax=Williamsia sp. D3 TaxID=1313067 RepID=UPI0003D39DCF|nr:HNH endonuclease signature motif containing protein [Williamsia sp. D3]ETD30187.1 hypothetical protein W823_26265 [Williamsia sp. D3]